MDRIHLSIYTKKIKQAVKALLFILRRSKRKFLVDLDLALKRGKLAGKSLIGKIAHNHHHHHHHHHHKSKEPDYYSAAGVFNYPDPESSDYVEFSCSNTPAHHVIVPGLSHLINGKKGGGAHKYKAQFASLEEEFVMEKAAIESALDDAVSMYSTPATGLSPAKQLRVTDSPYPLSSTGDSGHVDAAAEEFIRSFYSRLQRQPSTDG